MTAEVRHQHVNRYHHKNQHLPNIMSAQLPATQVPTSQLSGINLRSLGHHKSCQGALVKTEISRHRHTHRYHRDQRSSLVLEIQQPVLVVILTRTFLPNVQFARSTLCSLPSCLCQDPLFWLLPLRPCLFALALSCSFLSLCLTLQGVDGGG